MLQTCTVPGCRACPLSPQKLHSAGGQCLFVCMFTFHLPVHAMVVTQGASHSSSCDPTAFRCLLKILRHSILVWQ
jgi:hypothetical protein